MSLRDLRQSDYAPLLQKPAVRARLADCGSGRLEPAVFADHWPSDTWGFVLGLDSWHDLQTSRRGRQAHNLVLQINFSREHVQEVRRRFGRTDLFNCYFHPVLGDAERAGRETLAWARIDLDLQRDEALIEEIQSDWMATLARALRRGLAVDGERIPRNALRRYAEESLGWLCRGWSEAMLLAVIEFLRFEIGISNIYFHTWSGGVLTKGMSDWPPPRSVYTELPRKFCLALSERPPLFLQDDRRLRRLFRARPDIRFYRLEQPVRA